MSEVEKKEWYVVYSKPHREESAQLHLELKGIEVFFPRLLLPEFLQRRRRIVPLFPNYLFVRIHISEQYYYVLWSPGVKRFVTFNDIPVPIDDNILEFLKHQANADGYINVRSDLKPGQEVQITGGLFEGLVGRIQNLPDAKGRVKVLMKLLNREIKVEIPVHLVAGTWVPHALQGQGANINN